MIYGQRPPLINPTTVTINSSTTARQPIIQTLETSPTNVRSFPFDKLSKKEENHQKSDVSLPVSTEEPFKNLYNQWVQRFPSTVAPSFVDRVDARINSSLDKDWSPKQWPNSFVFGERHFKERFPKLTR